MVLSDSRSSFAFLWIASGVLPLTTWETRISGASIFSPIKKELAPGEVLKVDTGNVVAFETTVSYEIETVKGFANIFLGGEGLFLTKLVGPGKVILQSQNFKDFANRLIPYMPQPRSN